MINRFNKFLSRLLIVSLGLGLTLVISEILLRFVLPGSPLKVYNIDMRGVNQISKIPGLVYELKPEAERILRMGDHAATYRINSAGMRDYEYPLVKGNGFSRIVCLGDSVTFGAGVELNQTYSKVLEKLLNAKNYGIRYEVLNFGVSGYNTAQEAVVLKRKALQYRPDLVLVGFNLNDGNPTANLDEVLEGRGKKDTGRVPLPFKAWLQDNSYLYGVVALGGEQLLLRLGVWKRDRMYGLTAELFETMTEPRQETESWRRVEEGLRQIVDMSGRSGARVVLAVFPLQVQIDYDPRRPPMGNLTLTDLRRPQERLRRFAKENGIVYVDLLPPINSQRTRERPLFVNDVTSHPDALGHKIVAEEILRILVDHKLIPSAGR